MRNNIAFKVNLDPLHNLKKINCHIKRYSRSVRVTICCISFECIWTRTRRPAALPYIQLSSFLLRVFKFFDDNENYE